MSLPTIETERLILRQLKEADLNSVHSYRGNRENTEYMLLFGPDSEDETREFLGNAITAASQDPIPFYEYAITLKENGAVIGGGCIYIEGYCLAELGWILHRDYWHMGYAIEMARALTDFAFREMNVHRLIAHCDTENRGSYAVMEKLGMRREGHYLKSRHYRSKPDKGWGDEYCYAILRDEWIKKR